MSRSADAQSDGMNRTLATDTRLMRVMSGLAVIIGAWIALSPFAFEASETAIWNNVVVGLAVIILAGFNYYRMMSDRLGNVGVSGLVALFGLWALVVPFGLEMGSEQLFLGTTIAGLLLAVVGGYNVYANRRAGTAGTGARA